MMKGLIWLGLIFSFLPLVTSFSCTVNRQIENQTDQTLTIYYYGTLEPGATITREAPMGEFIIIALNTQGEIVFWQKFDFESVQKIDSRVWKAVIPPSVPHRGYSFVDLVIENRTDMILTVSFDGELVGDLNPGESITKNNFPILQSYFINEKYIEHFIIADNAQGQTVFRRILGLTSFEVIDLKTWKVMIEPE